MSKYRILSLDGGGIRGIIQAVLLERINREVNFIDKIDLAAGTSTGGLIALAVASGVDISEIKNIYMQKGSFIFNDTWYDDVKDVLGLAGADYNSENLLQVLKEVFGDKKLKDLQKHVLVTAFDLDNDSADTNRRSWQPVRITNFRFTKITPETSGPGISRSAGSFAADTTDEEATDAGLYISAQKDFSGLSVYKAAYYTAAAPTYFPSLDGYVDGGVFATNPSVEALCSAPEGEPVLFSLGTGISLRHIEGKNLDWGYAQWLQPLFGMMLNGQQLTAHQECSDLLGKKYFRLAPIFPADVSIDMDDVSKMEYMVQFANAIDIEPAVKFIKEFWL